MKSAMKYFFRQQKKKMGRRTGHWKCLLFSENVFTFYNRVEYFVIPKWGTELVPNVPNCHAIQANRKSNINVEHFQKQIIQNIFFY